MRMSPNGKYVYIDGRPVSVDLLYRKDLSASSADTATEEACAKMLEGMPIKGDLNSSYRTLLNTLLGALD